ncbi:LacI family transcriptional regulator [Sinirhodobacter populi]|uniref:LacI family transcriptional regulator n=2 Tax=Paenirhodobacter populi TaxID=2306993 RepID=A0A443IV72_9RHOB|nr:LacI family transcriptional regulator [Sinirhodobacter populi]
MRLWPGSARRRGDRLPRARPSATLRGGMTVPIKDLHEVSARGGFRAIAERAGVSVSTVDRVLNERGSVSAERRDRVLEAARLLGIRRILPEAWHRTRRVEIILPRNRPGNATPFWDRLDQAAQREARLAPAHVAFHRTRIPEGDVEALRQAILHPPVQRDALILPPDASDAIRQALRSVIDRGEQLLTIVTDIPGLPPHAYAGIDNRAAGRTAGFLMSGFVRGEGRLLVLAPGDQRQDHKDRVLGFAETVAARFPVDVIVTDETAERTRALTLEALRRGPVSGIYLTGHTPEAIADIVRDQPVKPVWISHELSPAHVGLLREGVLDFVLDQDPDAQIGWAVGMAISGGAIDGGEGTENGASAPRGPEFRIYCQTNV